MAGRKRQQLLPGEGALKEVAEDGRASKVLLPAAVADSCCVAPRHDTPTALARGRCERPVDAGRKRQQQVLWVEEGAKEDEGARGWTRGVLLAVAVARAASPLRRAGCGRQGGRDQRGVRGMQRHRRGLDVMGLCGAPPRQLAPATLGRAAGLGEATLAPTNRQVGGREPWSPGSRSRRRPRHRRRRNERA